MLIECLFFIGIVFIIICEVKLRVKHLDVKLL